MYDKEIFISKETIKIVNDKMIKSSVCPNCGEPMDFINHKEGFPSSGVFRGSSNPNIGGGF